MDCLLAQGKQNLEGDKRRGHWPCAQGLVQKVDRGKVEPGTRVDVATKKVERGEERGRDFTVCCHYTIIFKDIFINETISNKY